MVPWSVVVACSPGHGPYNGRQMVLVTPLQPINLRERHYCDKLYFFFFFFFFSRATDQQYGIRTKKSYLKTTRSCMDTPMNMYSSKGHIKRLTGAFFLADIQTMTYTQVHRYLGHASMFLLTLHQTMSHSVAKSADQS